MKFSLGIVESVGMTSATVLVRETPVTVTVPLNVTVTQGDSVVLVPLGQTYFIGWVLPRAQPQLDSEVG